MMTSPFTDGPDAGAPGGEDRFEKFRRSAEEKGALPEGCSAELAALWHARAGDWHQAHEIAQDIESKNGAWIHAYLHRVEGDPGNAAYWYQRAGKPVPRESTAEEWVALARWFLARG